MQQVGRKVAIKILVDRSEGGGDNNVNPSHKEFLRYEACLTSQLHHPNITGPSFPFKPRRRRRPRGHRHGVHGVLLDALVGESAYKLLPWRSRMFITLQVANAMQYLHSLRVVHLDLKASNLYLDMTDPWPVCKIGHIGLAGDRQRQSMCFTREADIAGYMVPKIFCEEGWPQTISAKADVYSFGVGGHVGAPSWKSSRLLGRKYATSLEGSRVARFGARVVLPTSQREGQLLARLVRSYAVCLQIFPRWPPAKSVRIFILTLPSYIVYIL